MRSILQYWYYIIFIINKYSIHFIDINNKNNFSYLVYCNLYIVKILPIISIKIRTNIISTKLNGTIIILSISIDSLLVERFNESSSYNSLSTEYIIYKYILLTISLSHNQGEGGEYYLQKKSPIYSDRIIDGCSYSP